MEYSITINQPLCIKHGLNYKEGVMLEFLSKLSTWATAYTFENEVYYNISYGKILTELPLVFSKKDTAYRALKKIRDLGFLEQQKRGKNQENYVRLSVKGKRVLRVGNKSEPCQGSDLNPTRVGNFSEPQKNAVATMVVEKSNQGSDLNPTYHNQHTINQIYIDKSAFNFLQKNNAESLEIWLMQNKKSIPNFEKFLEYFEVVVEAETIEYTIPKLFGRLKKLKFNWKGDFSGPTGVNNQPTIKLKRIG